MAFDKVVGQEKVIGLLRAVLRSGRIAHAYLFHGPTGVGKFAASIEFAKALLCDRPTGDGACEDCPSCRQTGQLAHPALRVVLPGPKDPSPEDERALLDQIAEEPHRVEQIVSFPTISIHRVRELKQFAAFPGSGRSGSVVLMPLADRMTPEAANSLLKLLEEPPERFTLVLSTADPGALPQTILSRCQMLRFSPLPGEEIERALRDRKGLDAGRARLVAQLASGSYGAALAWLEADTDALRARAVELLRTSLKPLAERVRFTESLRLTDSRDGRLELIELIDVLQVWMRDAQLVAELGEEDARPHLVNVDQMETLVRFNRNLSEVDYNAVAAALDEAAFQVQRNVSVRLILIGLLERFHRSIRR